MSKFEALRDAFQSGKERSWSYRDACYEMAREIAKGYREFLGVPEERIRFFPSSSSKIDFDDIERFSLYGGIELREEGFFHLGFAIDVTPDGWHSPQGILLHRIPIKKVEDRFVVKSCPDGEEHTIPAEESNSRQIALQELFQEMFELSKRRLSQSLEDFVQRGEGKRIGFSV